jgi:hypothetical protein
MNEYEYEPVPGLPYRLPDDEKILWQGSPGWRSLAVHLCHLRAISLYFAALMIWRVTVTAADGGSLAEALETVAWLSALLGVVAGFLGLFAFIAGRTTIYTITTRRVVLRYGIAFTKAVNVPLRIVQSAGLRLHADGTGDITLSLSGNDKIAYLILWPHVRPWRFKTPEPMLRVVPDPEGVARIIRGALMAIAKTDVKEPTNKPAPISDTGRVDAAETAAAA